MSEKIIKKTGVDNINTIYALIADDMTQVNQLIEKQLHSDVSLIDQLSHYIINSGGKRLRPAILLLCARAFNYQGQVHIKLATIIEFIHTATLLHDDVVDNSLLRRGHKTANQRWGNDASVLVGDFVYSRAFEMMVEIDSVKIMQILATATNTIAEGEVQQLINKYTSTITQLEYLQVIRNKTAKLFEAAAELGAVITQRTEIEQQAMATYGRHLGTAFQLIDDTLDYRSSPANTGKNIGADLAEGKPTLPLLYALWHSAPGDQKIIREAIENNDLTHIEQIKTAINNTGAIPYTTKIANEEAQLAINALAPLPPSNYADALHALALFSVTRNY